MTDLASTLRPSAGDLGRAATGGLLLGAPLLYTEEMWTLAESMPGSELAVVLFGTVLITVALHRVAGFRRSPDHRWSEAVVDGLTSSVFAALLTALTLCLLGVIDVGRANEPGWWGREIARTAVTAIPVVFGATIARFVLDGSRASDTADDAPSSLLAELGATAIGAAALGSSVAPTDEIPQLASELGYAAALAFVLVCVALSYVAVFVADFDGHITRSSASEWWNRPLPETLLSCGAAYAVGALLLIVLGSPSAAPFWSQLVVIGLPATIGGAAGRLAL